MAFFAEPFTLKRQGYPDAPLNGIFTQEISDKTLGAATFTDRLYHLHLEQTIATDYKIAPQQSVTLKNITYQIVDVQNDTNNLSTLTLRRF